MTTAIMTTTRTRPTSRPLTAPIQAGGALAFAIPGQQRRRLRPSRPVPPAWACENCDLHNEGRRRRCIDCGTSRL